MDNTSSPIKQKSKFKNPFKLLGIIAILITVITGSLQLSEYYNKSRTINLSGSWILKNKILNSSYNPYRGLELSYKLNVSQNADGNIVGFGEKFLENKTEIPFKERIPIEFTGFNYGDSVILIIKESGKFRETSCSINLNRIINNTLTGSFKSTAANCSGTTILNKE